MLGADAHPVAPHGGGHGGDGLVLADDVGLEPLLQLAEPLEFLLPDLGGGDLCPKLDDMGQIVHAQLGIALFAKGGELRVQLELLALEEGHALVIRLGALLSSLLFQHGALFLIIVQLPLDLHAAGDIRILEVQVGAGLVDQVDGLVRQEAVGDVAFGEHHRLAQYPLGDLDTVVLLILGSQALEDLHGILDGRLIHRHWLEAPLQGSVLLDGLAVFIEGGGSDHLDLAPGEGGFEDIGGIHAALGIAGTHNVVDFVDHQNDVAQALDLVNEALHPGLKLAPELGTRHQGGEIQQIDLLLPQLEGDIAGSDALGQTLGDGSLAHAGLTDEAGVILLSAVQDLNHPLDLLLPANHRIQLALLGLLRQGDAVALQIFALAVFSVFPFLLPAPGRTVLRRGAALTGPGRVGSGEQPVQEGERGGLALLFLLPGVLSAGQVLDILHPVEGLHHLIVDGVQILVGDPHALHHLVYLREPQLLGALEAKALIGGLVPLHFGDEHHGDVFLTS